MEKFIYTVSYTHLKIEKTRFGDALAYKFEHTAINYNEEGL